MASMLISFEQPLNMFAIVVTLGVLNEVRLSVVSVLHPLNIAAIVVTLTVLKLLRSRAFSAAHPLNIFAMLVTLAVVKLVLSVSVANFVQPLNMSAIVVTLAVLNVLRLSAVRAEQPLNIPAIVVTSEVVRLPGVVTVDSFVQPLNQFWHLVGLTFLNEASNFTVVMVPFTVLSHAGVAADAVTAVFVPPQTLVIVCPPYVPPTL